MAEEAESKMSESEKKKEDWMNSKWRPMMGWMYMCVCSFDFVFAPIMWSLLQSLSHGAVNVQWQPLTLQGAGLFHISMGAVLGIAAFGRTQEKLAGQSAVPDAAGLPSPTLSSATPAPAQHAAPAAGGFKPVESRKQSQTRKAAERAASNPPSADGKAKGGKGQSGRSQSGDGPPKAPEGV